MRIDADVAGALKEESEEDSELKSVFEKALDGKHVTVKTEKLKDEKVPAVVNVAEFARRLSEMHAFYGMGESPADITLVVNVANGAVQALRSAGEEAQKKAAMQIYYLARMNYRPLKPEELSDFVETNTLLLENYLKK